MSYFHIAIPGASDRSGGGTQQAPAGEDHRGLPE